MVEKTIGYKCQECGEIHSTYYDAKECCPIEIEEIGCYECDKCGALHEDEEDAEECCSIKER